MVNWNVIIEGFSFKIGEIAVCIYSDGSDSV